MPYYVPDPRYTAPFHVVPIDAAQPWRRLRGLTRHGTRLLQQDAIAACTKHGAVMVYDDMGRPMIRGRYWQGCAIVQYARLPY